MSQKTKYSFLSKDEDPWSGSDPGSMVRFRSRIKIWIWSLDRLISVISTMNMLQEEEEEEEEEKNDPKIHL